MAGFVAAVDAGRLGTFEHIEQVSGFHCVTLGRAATCAGEAFALADDVILATHLNGEPLDGRHGAPLRLVSPSQYGYKNVKHLVGIDFRTSRPDSTMGPKERHATLPNWAVRVPYRAMFVPVALAAERGLRRSP